MEEKNQSQDYFNMLVRSHDMALIKSLRDVKVRPYVDETQQALRAEAEAKQKQAKQLKIFLFDRRSQRNSMARWLDHANIYYEKLKQNGYYCLAIRYEDLDAYDEISYRHYCRHQLLL